MGHQDEKVFVITDGSIEISTFGGLRTLILSQV